MVSKTWQRKEWKENRKEKLKEYCEICGNKENLVIHHWFKILPFKIRVQFVGRELFNDLIKEGLYDDFKNLGKGTCPKCNHSFYERKTIKPKYKCYNPRCNFEFDKPIKNNIPIKIINSLFGNFKFMNYDSIGEITNDLHKQVVERYNQMWWKDISTLCNRCHYKIHNGDKSIPFQILRQNMKYL